MPKRISKTSPINLERDLRSKGNAYIIGIDEAGRGALAGALTIGYCILPLHRSDEWIMSTFEGVTDSKRLSEKRRTELAIIIRANALACESVSIGAGLIDKMGLTAANQTGVKLAVNNAVEQLRLQHQVNTILYPNPDEARVYVLCDKGLHVPYDPHSFPYGTLELIGGELRSLSIAAASVIAKVSRDATMSTVEVADDIRWGFAKHKGYGTAAHIAAIREHGAHSIHRRTFAPIPSILFDRGER